MNNAVSYSKLHLSSGAFITEWFLMVTELCVLRNQPNFKHIDPCIHACPGVFGQSSILSVFWRRGLRGQGLIFILKLCLAVLTWTFISLSSTHLSNCQTQVSHM